MSLSPYNLRSSLPRSFVGPTGSNDIPYNPPKVPSTLVALNMGDEADNPGVYGPVGNNLVLEYNKTVEVTLWNTDDGEHFCSGDGKLQADCGCAGPHPFHLHGHTPMLARRQNMGDELVPIEEDQSNPMRRDTYTVDGVSACCVRQTFCQNISR